MTFDNGKTIDCKTDSGSMEDPYQNIRILTVQEVADLLRVHRTTVSRYAASGELKSYIIGNRRLFKEEDVLAFFDNRIDRAALEYVAERRKYGNGDYSKA